MKIWIDIDNSPHVPFFKPIVRALEARGDTVLITTRRYAQTLQLLEDSGMSYHVVGEHAGANPIAKVVNLVGRSFALSQLVRSFAPDVAVSHGSRALSLASWMMNIPGIVFFDYEWTEMQIFKRCARVLACPQALPDEALQAAHLPMQKIRRYPGLKEQVYLADFKPDPEFRSKLGIAEDKVVATIRPSSMTSNYHDQRSEQILVALLKRLKHEQGVVAIITPRTATDRALVEEVIQREALTNIIIPERALPGMQLLYASDLVVSGGGTMNREAALLGTRTYSMFTGKRPAIDSYLASQNRLHFLENPEDVDTIQFQVSTHRTTSPQALDSILPNILALIDECAVMR